MPKFNVCFTREITQTVSYTIEAEDEEVAEIAAQSLLDAAHADGEAKWKTQDSGFVPVRCASIDLEEEDDDAAYRSENRLRMMERGL